MNRTEVMPIDMKVLMNHIYEYQKGVRSMVLFTFNKRYREFAVNRLRSKGIQYLLMPVGNDRFNLFFGKRECMDVISHLVNCPLYELSPEKDFILGAMLGYNICDQCKRYCSQMRKSAAGPEGRAKPHLRGGRLGGQAG